DEQTLKQIFISFVRERKRIGDLRPGAALVRDLLGEAVRPDIGKALTGALPWYDRMGLSSRRRIARLGAGAVVVATTLAGAVSWGRAHPSIPPDAVLVAYWKRSDGNGTDAIDVPIREAAWRTLDRIEVNLRRNIRWHFASEDLLPLGVDP